MGEAPVSLVVARYLAVAFIVLATLVPLPFARERNFTMASHDAQARARSMGPGMVALRQKAVTFAATRRQAPRQIAWLLVGVFGLAAAVAEGIAYRRAIAGQRRAGLAGSVARGGPVVAAAGFAVVGCWYAWESKTLMPAFGMTMALGATILIAITFLREAIACRAGQRGWVPIDPEALTVGDREPLPPAELLRRR